jgi:hypothetical protein
MIPFILSMMLCYRQPVAVCYPDEHCGSLVVTVCPSKAYGLFISGDEAIVSDAWGEDNDN